MMYQKQIILVNALVYRGRGFEICDVWIDNGFIRQIASHIAEAGIPRIDMVGLVLLPGLVDVHVHLREPGFTYKETIASGTAAAAHGGYTAICPMPNLNPAPDTLDTLNLQLERIQATAAIKVFPYACITKGQKGEGELVNFEELSAFVSGFSDDGRGVQKEDLMREAMKQVATLNKTIVAHCEVNELIEGGYIHKGNYAKTHNHKGICSESEWEQVKRDIALARETGCRYHVCHISTKESVSLIRQAKAEGIKVTCETAPHYLLLTDADLKEDGNYKMNPPIRSFEDRAALIEGLIDGTIDCIATDHAPHSLEEKSKGLAGSAFGIVGIETAFPLMYTYFVRKNIITLEHLVDVMCINPRRIFGFNGLLTEGEPADIAVMNLNADYKINPNQFMSMGKSMPFAGWSVNSECVMTLVNGQIAYQLSGLKLDVINE